ncbi:MAG: polyphenol oxidase family protein [Muribaculaceae bacterium]|nr:polyphenol oxidase family protein [Muribaculaceae bacterium]
MRKIEIYDDDEIDIRVYTGEELGNRSGGGEPDLIDSMALTPVQTHSVNVAVVDRATSSPVYDCDAYITFSTDVPIGIRTADCVPILIYSKDIKAIGAIHAGWKGTLGGILDNVVGILMEKGSKAENILLYFGPSISGKNYEVDSALAQQFIDAGFETNIIYCAGTSRPHIDLEGVNHTRAKTLGIPAQNIHRSDFCTFDSKDEKGKYLFPSYRREKGTDRRLLTTIRLKG